MLSFSTRQFYGVCTDDGVLSSVDSGRQILSSVWMTNQPRGEVRRRCPRSFDGGSGTRRVNLATGNADPVTGCVGVAGDGEKESRRRRSERKIARWLKVEESVQCSSVKLALTKAYGYFLGDSIVF
ncbi:hypothetical protein Droror1_Dr00026165 [Drosera rotundifolia]